MPESLRRILMGLAGWLQKIAGSQTTSESPPDISDERLRKLIMLTMENMRGEQAPLVTSPAPTKVEEGSINGEDSRSEVITLGVFFIFAVGLLLFLANIT